MNTVLLVLDIQKDFVGEHGRMPVSKQQTEPMIHNINLLIQKAEKTGVPVIYIGNEFEKYQWIANFFRKFAGMKGSPGAPLDERL